MEKSNHAECHIALLGLVACAECQLDSESPGRSTSQSWQGHLATLTGGCDIEDPQNRSGSSLRSERTLRAST